MNAKMKTTHYTLRFVTPAFLGDATQNGRWRTPPLKALLRQWWRVAFAQAHDFQMDVREMRRIEGCLFGNAWLKTFTGPSRTTAPGAKGPGIQATKSLLRLRLDRWDEGRTDIKAEGSVSGATRREGSLDPLLRYIGYGPLEKNIKAIKAGDTDRLDLAWPEVFPSQYKEILGMTCHEGSHAEIIHQCLYTALWLVDRYGALGSRSRNGWGSVELEPLDSTASLRGEPPLRLWTECLKLDWPHAIGADNKGALIWQTEPRQDWKEVMKDLGTIRKDLRAKFGFEERVGEPGERHWLAYPVTGHSVEAWDKKNLRLPNTLRFKIRKAAGGTLVGVIFHMPHLPPEGFEPTKESREKKILEVWKRVYHYLDNWEPPTDHRSQQPGGRGAHSLRRRVIRLQRVQE